MKPMVNALFSSEVMKAGISVVKGTSAALAISSVLPRTKDSERFTLMVVLAVWQGFGENDPVAVGAMVLAICCYGIGGPFIKRFITPLNLPNEVAAFGQVGGAAVFMLPVYLTGPLVVGEISADVVLAMLALGAIGSGLAYIWYFQIIKVAGSAIANSVTYITPLVATFLGVLLLSEKLHWYEPVGAVVVIIGAMISQGRLRLNRSYR